jgi:hypothetical protein
VESVEIPLEKLETSSHHEISVVTEDPNIITSESKTEKQEEDPQKTTSIQEPDSSHEIITDPIVTEPVAKTDIVETKIATEPLPVEETKIESEEQEKPQEEEQKTQVNIEEETKLVESEESK